MKHVKLFENFIFENKISIDMPNSMKKFIENLIKNSKGGWSHELVDLTNSIIRAHREYDLDLLDSEPGPEFINMRNLPTDKLTPKSIESINKIWPKMSEWAKESIYDDYSHWFKVTKKYRPYFGQK